MPSITFGQTTIAYEIRRSNERETVTVAVDPKEGVLVSAPVDVDGKKISSIVKKKASWILEKQLLFDQIKEPPLEKEFLSGEKLAYIGRRYRLKLIPSPDTNHVYIKLLQGKFLIYHPVEMENKARRNQIKDAFISWYREKALEKLHERVEEYAPIVGVTPTTVKIRNQSKRWGSCTEDGNLIYNWRIIMAPMSIIDYVVVHELCHLKEPNHTEDFWRHLSAILPDYNQRKEWLRINGSNLILK